jgi:hypothetical protein
MSDAEHHDHPASPPRPSLLAGLMQEVLTLPVLIALLSAAGTIGVARYRQDEQEKAFAAHLSEAKEQRGKVDSRIADLESEMRSTEKNHGDRILVLEERYTEIKGLLAEIKGLVVDRPHRER